MATVGESIRTMKGYADNLRPIMEMADTMTRTKARLNLLVDDGGSVEDLQNKIMASANRVRAPYQQTADTIAKLGIGAKNAFGSNDEIIAFTEQLNKNFALSGTSVQGIEKVMGQLTQSMASGVLKEEELNSILGQAPTIIPIMEDYLGLPIDQIRNMAQEGQISANIIKNALFAAADDTNRKFQELPMTWAQLGDLAKNILYPAFEPVLRLIASGAQFIYDNWSIIGPLFWGIVAALGAYYAVLSVTNIAQGISNALTAWATFQRKVFAASMEMATGATFMQAVAQYGLNAALYACPIAWIILGIIALIAVFYAVIAAVNKFAGTSISATGAICAVVAAAAAVIGNIIIGLINGMIQWLWTRFVEPFLGIIEFILNAANGGFDSFGDAVANLIGQIISWFLSLGKIVTKIIDAIFGTDWTASLSAWQNDVLAWGKNENAITLDRNAPAIDHRFDYGDAWDKGNEFGRGIEDKFKNLFNTDNLDFDLNPNKDILDNLGSISNNAANTAGNTAAMKDSMDIAEEDLKYMRDIAEREAINRFTTADIAIDMSGMSNSINSTMDLDGVVSYLEEKVYETMEIAAEGVHV